MRFYAGLLGLLLIGMLCLNVYGQQAKKTTVAVLEFQSGGGLDRNDATILTNRFRAILVQTQVFDVIEREKMNEILKEQDFAISDQCNTAECAVQVGRLLQVENMIAGDIGKLGQTYSINLRLIDVSTGKIAQTKTQDYRGEIDGLLAAMTEIANAFAGVESITAKSTNVGDIYVVSNPSKASIYMDGKLQEGVTPKLLEGISAGKHIIEVRSGDLIARKEIDLKKGGIENVELKLGKITIPVKLTSEPAGAKIIVNSDELGLTPTVVNIPAGAHKIVLKKDGYEDFVDSLTVKEGEISKSLKATLKKLYTLTVKPVLPEGVTAKSVEIIIDDKIRRNDRLSLALPEGKHIIKVVSNLAILTEYSKIINLASDQLVEAQLEYTYDYLEKKKIEEQNAMLEKQRLEKEKQEKLIADQNRKEEELRQLALKEEMERKAKEAKEHEEQTLKDKKEKEAKEKSDREKAQTLTRKKSSKTMWYIIGGAAVAGGGAAAVLLGGKKGGGGKSALPLPEWPF